MLSYEPMLMKGATSTRPAPTPSLSVLSYEPMLMKGGGGRAADTELGLSVLSYEPMLMKIAHAGPLSRSGAFSALLRADVDEGRRRAGSGWSA